MRSSSIPGLNTSWKVSRCLPTLGSTTIRGCSWEELLPPVLGPFGLEDQVGWLHHWGHNDGAHECHPFSGSANPFTGKKSKNWARVIMQWLCIVNLQTCAHSHVMHAVHCMHSLLCFHFRWLDHVKEATLERQHTLPWTQFGTITSQNHVFCGGLCRALSHL